MKSLEKVKETLVTVAEANLTGDYTTGWGDYSTLKVGDF